MKIKIDETHRDVIENALKEVNGTAQAHTFTTFEDLQEVSERAEQRISEFGLAKTHRPGARAGAVSCGPLPSAYRGEAAATIVEIERGHDAWFLRSSEKTYVSGGHDGASDTLRVRLSEDQMRHVSHARGRMMGVLPPKISDGDPEFAPRACRSKTSTAELLQEQVNDLELQVADLQQKLAERDEQIAELKKDAEPTLAAP
jgi:hypothetical protein